MNRKDVENIGYAMAVSRTKQELADKLLRLDPGIADEVDGFVEVCGKSEAVQEEYNRLMTERLGHMWSCTKLAKEIGKEVYAQAHQNVCGKGSEVTP